MTLHTFASKTFEADTFEAGVFTGVGADVVTPIRRAILGRTRIVPKVRGVTDVRPKVRGVYGSRSPAASSFAAESYALFGDGITTLADAQAFIQRFLNLMNGTTAISAAFNEYLTTEGWLIADAAVDGEGITLNERHMLYWLDHELKRRKAQIGYVNRLSEAGWGEAAPDNLADADPFDLVTTLEGLGHSVALVDYDADEAGTNNLSASSTDGCVRIARADDNTVKAIDNTTAKTNPNDNLFGSGQTAYQYKFWKTLDDLVESSGANLRFVNAEVESFLLVRYSAADHVVQSENYLGRQDSASQAQNTQITIRGYPGEWPEIWCGNSTDNDATPTECPDSTLSPRNAVKAAFLTNFASTKYRNNVHWRNLIFHGKRQTAGGDWIFAERIFYHAGGSAWGTGWTWRHCQFLDYQPIETGDANAGTHPNLVDLCSDGTDRTSPTFNAIYISGASGATIDSCYFRPVAVADWPGDTITNGNVNGYCIDSLNANGLRITRNTFAGVKTNSRIRALGTGGNNNVDGYVADNKAEVWDKKFFTAAGIDGWTIERNFVHDWARNGYTLEGGGAAVSITGSQDCIIRYNVFFNHEPADESTGGILIQNGTGNENGSGHRVYGNILYRSGLIIDHNVAGTHSDCEIYNNLIAGVPNGWRTAGTPDGIVDASIRVNFLNDAEPGVLTGFTIRDNAFWRFPNASPTSSEDEPHLSLLLTASTSALYQVDDTLDGWTDNVLESPDWAGDPESDDFRLSGTNTFDAWFSADMPFTESLSKAWEPN